MLIAGLGNCGSGRNTSGRTGASSSVCLASGTTPTTVNQAPPSPSARVPGRSRPPTGSAPAKWRRASDSLIITTPPLSDPTSAAVNSRPRRTGVRMVAK